MLEEFRSTVKNGKKRPSWYPRSQPVLPSPAFSLSIVCTPSWQQLQHFDLLFAGAATATVQLLTFWKLAKKRFEYDRRPFYNSFLYAFFLIENRSTVSHRPVTAQLQPVTDHSSTIRRPVSTDRKHIAVRTVNSCQLISDQSLTSCESYRRLIGDHKLIPNMGITVSTIASHCNKIDREQVASRSQLMCDDALSTNRNRWPWLTLSEHLHLNRKCDWAGSAFLF